MDQRVHNESDELTRATSGPHALRRIGAIGLEVGERAEVCTDDGAEGPSALRIERLVD